MKPRRFPQFSAILAGPLAILLASQSTQAAPYTWIGNSAATQAWDTTSNWDGGAVASGPGTTSDTLTFFTDTITDLAEGSNLITTKVPAALTMNVLTLNGKGAATTGATNITIGTNASTWTLGGTTPTVNLNGVNGTQALNHTVASNLALGAATTFTGGGTAGFNFSGTISGAFGITKSGTSTLTLSGANTFTGGITTSAGGTLVLKNSSAGGTGTIYWAVPQGAILKLDNSGTGQNIILTNTVVANGGTLINVAGDNKLTGSGLSINSSTSNTYYRVDGGTLEIAGGYGAGTTGRTAHFEGTGHGLYSGNITFGNNTLRKNGTGTWTLSGANTYSGATNVAQGTLVARRANALGTSPVSVSANANLSYVAATDTTLNLGSTLSITGGTSTVIGASIGSTETSAAINVTGNATTTVAAVKVNVFGISGVTPLSGTNTYTLIHGGGAANTLNNASYTLGTVYNNTNFTVAAPTATTDDLQVDITSETPITSAYWKGGLTGATNVWAASNGSTQSNWTTTSGGADQPLAPGADADVTVSNSSITTAPNSTFLGADMTIKSLTIADTTNGLGLGADFYTLTISPLTSTAGITMNSSVPASTIAARVKLGAAQTWTNNSSNALTVNGAISGSGSLTKAGTGNLVLSGSNTFTGDTLLNSGTITLSNQIAAQSSTVNMNGGTLLFDQSVTSNAFTFGGLGGSSNLVLQNNAGSPAAIALTVGANTSTYSGILSGAGSLNKTGAGNLTLSGANDFTGTVSINGGTLTITKSSALGQGNKAIHLTNGGTLALDNTGTGTDIVLGSNFTFPLTFAGATIKNVAGNNSIASGLITSFNATNCYLRSDAGSLTLLGNFGMGSYTNARTLILQGAGTGFISGNISDNISSANGILTITKQDAGTWTFSGTNTYRGATTVNAGTLALVGGSNASPITVGASAWLGFTLNSSVVSSNSVTLVSGSKIKITGSPVSPTSYTLMTASSIDGTPVLDTPIPGYSLTVEGGNVLKLIPDASGFSSWIATGAFGLALADQDPTDDPDNDGVENMLEYVLNGNPSISDASILPDLDVTGANFVFTFTRREESTGDTTQTFQYGSDLSGWTPLSITAPTAAEVALGTPSGGLQSVTVTIPKSLASGGKLFGRLQVVKIP